MFFKEFIFHSMKQHGDYIIADAGKYLISGRIKGLKMPADREYEEYVINTDNITKVNDLYFVDNLLVVKEDTYGNMKKKLINGIYSNDDQIAIMLNGDEKMMQLMQDWRSWFSSLIHLIID